MVMFDPCPEALRSRRIESWKCTGRVEGDWRGVTDSYSLTNNQTVQTQHPETGRGLIGPAALCDWQQLESWSTSHADLLRVGAASTKCAFLWHTHADFDAANREVCFLSNFPNNNTLRFRAFHVAPTHPRKFEWRANSTNRESLFPVAAETAFVTTYSTRAQTLTTDGAIAYYRHLTIGDRYGIVAGVNHDMNFNNSSGSDAATIQLEIGCSSLTSTLVPETISTHELTLAPSASSTIVIDAGEKLNALVRSKDYVPGNSIHLSARRVSQSGAGTINLAGNTATLALEETGSVEFVFGEPVLMVYKTDGSTITTAQAYLLSDGTRIYSRSLATAPPASTVEYYGHRTTSAETTFNGSKAIIDGIQIFEDVLSDEECQSICDRWRAQRELVRFWIQARELSDE